MGDVCGPSLSGSAEMTGPLDMWQRVEECVDIRFTVDFPAVASWKLAYFRLEQDQIRGVEYVGTDGVATIRAERKAVLCCGAFQTPKPMMLSGLGPADQLTMHGISVVCDLESLIHQGVVYDCS